MTYIDYMNQFWRAAEQEPFPVIAVGTDTVLKSKLFG